jgi:hypothetical protein
MGWVKGALLALKENGECQIRPHGGSMRGRIESGQLVTIKAVVPSEVSIDDVIFVRWKGNHLLHIAIDIEDGEVLVGNNLGKTNGWVPLQNVVGVAVRVED